jgi:hypothetical protein
MRWSWMPVLGLAVLPLLAGCMATSALPMPELRPGQGPAPDTLGAPTWSEGAHWSYRSLGGEWRNVTVLGEQERQGRPMVVVQVDRAPAVEGVARLFQWRDPQTLAIWAYMERGDVLDFPCEVDPIFPVVDQAQRECVVAGQPQTFPAREVGGWHTLGSGLDSTAVLEMRFSLGDERWRAWYSPEIGNYAAFHGPTGAGGRDLFVLVSPLAGVPHA